MTLLSTATLCSYSVQIPTHHTHTILQATASTSVPSSTRANSLCLQYDVLLELRVHFQLQVESHATSHTSPTIMASVTSAGGTGNRLTAVTIILTGVASLVATLISLLYEKSALEKPSCALG